MTAVDVVAGVGAGVAVFLFVLIERLTQRVARLEGEVSRLNGHS